MQQPVQMKDIGLFIANQPHVALSEERRTHCSWFRAMYLSVYREGKREAPNPLKDQTLHNIILREGPDKFGLPAQDWTFAQTKHLIKQARRCYYRSIGQVHHRSGSKASKSSPSKNAIFKELSGAPDYLYDFINQLRHQFHAQQSNQVFASKSFYRIFEEAITVALTEPDQFSINTTQPRDGVPSRNPGTYSDYRN